MATTNYKRTLLRFLFVFVLFFTSCVFLDSWREPFFLNSNYQNLKFILSLLLPFSVSLCLFIYEKSFVFAGKACAVMMSVKIVLYFVDLSALGVISSSYDNAAMYYNIYALLSFFSVLLSALFVATIKKTNKDYFTRFYNDFFTGYLVFAIFLYALFFIIRRSPLDQTTSNLGLFHGEMYYLFIAIKYKYCTMELLFHTLGNVMFFATVPFIVYRFIKKRKLLFLSFIIPAIISILTEASQYFQKTGDCDIDDIFLNCLGALMGIIIYNLFIKKQLKEI